ncbi:MAG: PBP1A family penicillin-binding protein [Xanthobacteraceae bacterium]
MAGLKRILLDIDARIDFAVFRAGYWIRELFERFVVVMDRFHVGGWRRWVLVEPISEGLTLGVGGSILMLALAIPAFRETSDEDWLKKSELAVVFLDRFGNEVGSRGVKQNDSIPLQEFPDHLIKAVLATEDRRFYEHFGIDIGGTFRALLTNAKAGGVVQGGSSLSQQLAKNLFLSNERTIERKVKEAFLAVWLETHLTKNEIFKLYLDRAYMGGGTYGVDAAAQYYFGKSARDVNLAEAAMLAGLFKAPGKFAPHINLPAARARANVVLDNLVEAGFMTQGQVFGARRNPAKTIDRRDENAPNYYLDYAFEEMRKLADTLPRNITERNFVVRTALDPGLQQSADNALQGAIREFGRSYGAKQGALVVADLDGGVRAMVGGVDYSESQFNRAADAKRQPGSSFKPYVYAAALMEGMTPKSIVVDGPVCLGNWCPKNYSGGYRGRMTLLQALTRSVNTIAVKLSIFIGKGEGGSPAGRAKIIKLAHEMGIQTPLEDTPSLPIGAGVVTVVNHTVAYATFPNAGKAVRAHAVLEVRTGTGETIWRYDRDGPKPKQVMPPKVAADMAYMMNSVVEQGTARRAILNGIKAAGKTGTTNAYRDAWFVGYTGNFVCGVWYGNDDYRPTNRMTGGSLPAMTWHTVMEYAHQDVELHDIPGLPPNPAKVGPRIAESKDVPRPAMLTYRGVQVLSKMEKLFDEAARLPAPDAARDERRRQSKADGTPSGTVAAAQVEPGR